MALPPAPVDVVDRPSTRAPGRPGDEALSLAGRGGSGGPPPTADDDPPRPDGPAPAAGRAEPWLRTGLVSAALGALAWWWAQLNAGLGTPSPTLDVLVAVVLAWACLPVGAVALAVGLLRLTRGVDASARPRRR